MRVNKLPYMFFLLFAFATQNLFAQGISVTASTVTNVSCFGGSGGSIHCSYPTGGTYPYSYSWNSGAYTSQDVSGLPAGTYVVTVTDALGHTASSTTSVTQPSTPVSVSVTGTTTISCYGGTTSLTLTGSGGSGGYTLESTCSLGSGPFTSTMTFSSVAAGTYTFTIEDVNSCAATAYATVTSTGTSALTATSSAGTISCHGGTTSVTVGASGGTSPYSGTGTFSAVGAGTHTYTVTDANGCSTTTSVTISEPATLTASATGAIICHGGTATVNVTGSGGTSPYTGTGTFTGVTAGAHTYTITDANGCTASNTITLTDPAGLSASSSAGTILCHGGTTSVTVSGSGGVMPYSGTGSFTGVAAGVHSYTVTDVNGCSATTSVTISDPAGVTASSSAGTISCHGGTTTVIVSGGGGTGPYSGTGSITGVVAGTHTYTVTDANGCTATTTITISEPPALAASSTAGIIACHGGTTTVTVTGSGGTGSITGTGTFSGVSAGSHTYTVTDASGCTATTTITITDPAVISTIASTVAEASCFGLTDGNIHTSTPSGGTYPYSFSWTPGSYTTQDVTSVGANTYTVTVTDAHGCTVSSGTIVTQPALLTASASMGTAINCHGGTTTITLTASGGTLGYSLIATSIGTAGVYSSPTTFSGAAAGTYNFTVEDANDCDASTSITLSEPAALTASSSAGTILCHGGTTTVTVSGSGGTGTITGTGTFSGVLAGTHTYTVTDAHGCTATTTITISEPALLTASSTAGSIACHGGTTTVTVSGSGGTGSYTGTGAITGVNAGSHTYTITDANSCSASTTITVTEPTVLTASSSAGTISCHGGTTTVTVSGSGGTGGYSGTGAITGVIAGTHTYTVTDANGCTATTTITVSEPAVLTASSTSGAISCHGGTTTVTVSASGGTTSYSGTGSITGVNAGTHSYTVTDAGGCTASTSITITEPTVLTASSTAGTIACHGGTTTITVTAAGGTGTITGTGTHTVGAGTYTYTVTDANSCTASTTITVTDPTALSVTASTTTEVTCFGGSTGSVHSLPSGGTSPYVYSWSPGLATTQDVYGLAANTYIVTVTDAGGCTATGSTIVTQPAALTASSTSGSISCHGGTTTVTVSASGGTTPYAGTGSITGVSAGTHTYTVTDANGCTTTTTITITEPAVLTASSTSGTISCHGGTTTVTVSAAGGTTSYSGTGTITGVIAGTHTYTVTDANGCTATTTITISEPATLRASSTAGSIACNGGTTTVTVSGSGGTGPYAGTGAITGVNAGSHTYTITDANSCSATTSITLTEPTVLTASSSAGTISCHGGTTTVTVSGSGGTGGYSGTGAITGVIAGTHTYTVTDANGCTATTSITITEPTALTASSTSGAISCHGGTTTVTVSASGGTTSYSGTGSITGVNAGTHSYTVTDANGCTASTSITITEPTVLTASSTAGTIACHGGTTTITVTAAGGTGTITGTGTHTVGAGTYTYTVTDANSCTASTTITLTDPTALSVTASTVTQVTCFGGSTGSVHSLPSGGTSPYVYSWSPGLATTQDVYGLAANTYIVTVTDAGGCTATGSTIVTQPTALTASSTSGSISCHGGTTTVTVTASGGTTPYAGTGSITGVSAGTHTYTVTDANGCTTTTTITITEPAVLTASSTSGTISCHGGTTTVTVSAAGGTTSYSGTGTITGVIAGTHTYTVTDANGCTATTTITISEPATLTASSTAGSIACNGGTTTVTVSGSGGTGPYTGTGAITGVNAGSHTYTITDANSCSTTTSITLTEPTVLTASSSAGTISCHGGTTTVTVSGSGGTGGYSGTGAIAGVIAGTHTYTVTDANGCTATTSITITEPTALTASSTSGAISCHGGTTTVTVSASGGTTSYSGTGSITGVNAGTHSYTVTDANGCTASTSITITEPTALTASSTAGTISCHGGTTTITITASGGTGTITGTGTHTVGAGTYTYTVTDANSCTASTTITITEPDVLFTTASDATEVTCFGGSNGSVTTSSPSGGTSPFTYSWTGGATSQSVSGLVAGTYNVTVTDANGCTATSSATVTQPAAVTASASAGTILCHGGTTALVLSGSGGTGGLTLISSSLGSTGPFTSTHSFTGTGAGTYNFTLQDANSCNASTSITITEPPALTASNTAGTILCHGGTATVTVSGSGGTGTITGTGTFTALAGVHSYTVTDANGCMASTSVTLSEPAAITASSTAGTIVCHGGTTTVVVSASGGTGTLTGTGSFTAGAGSHTYTITDANGCTATTSITLTEPTLLVVTATASPNPICAGSTLGLTSTESGGTTPYANYTWEDPNAAVLGSTQNVSVTAATTGVYSVSVTDHNGCTLTGTTASVTVNALPVITVAAAATPNPVCAGSALDLTVTATGTGLSYSWSGPGAYSAGTQNPVIAGITTGGAGVYTVTVTDVHSCTVMGSTSTVVVNATVPVVPPIDGPSLVSPGFSMMAYDDTLGGTWSSSNLAIGSIEPSTGAVHGVQPGWFIISYIVTNACGSTTVTKSIDVSASWCNYEDIWTCAGEGSNGYDGDGGPATAAHVNTPKGTCSDKNGNIYIADDGAHCIRKIDASNGHISTFCGTGSAGFGGDGGSANSAQLNTPKGVACDVDGNVYIADYGNHRVRKVDPSGNITTCAGNGSSGWSGDGGPATSAKLSNPIGVACDKSGNLHILNFGSDDVRKVDRYGTIRHECGTPGTAGYSGDGGVATAAALRGPTGIACDKYGNVFICDEGNVRVRKIDTFGNINNFAGTGSDGTSGDGGLAITSSLDQPYAVCADADDNIYISDRGPSYRIRIVNTSGIIGTYAGNETRLNAGDGGLATAGSITTPFGICMDPNDRLFICEADPGSGYMREVAPLHIPSTAGPDSVCTGATATISDSLTGGTWTSTDLTKFTVGLSSGIITGVAAGTATISYTFGSTCRSIDTITVHQTPYAITGTMAICDGFTSVLNESYTAQPGTWFSSNTGVGTIPATPTAGNNGTVTSVAPGFTTISYTVTATGCYTTSNFTVYALPVPTFTVHPGASACDSNNVTYTTQASQFNYLWTVPGVLNTDYSITSPGLSTTDHTVTLKWLTSGSKTVSIDYTDLHGCTAVSPTSNTTTSNTLPTVTLTGPGALSCDNNSVTYTTDNVAGDHNYIWSVPGILGTNYTVSSGSTGTSSHTVTLAWLTTGSKTVSVDYTDINGCTALTVPSNVTVVNALPVVTITPSAGPSVCTGQTVTYTTQAAENGYIWNVSGTLGTDYTYTLGTSTDNTIVVTWLTAAARTVSVNYTVPATGCTAASPTVNNVTVNSTPVVTVPSSLSVCNTAATGALTFSSSVGSTTYAWTNSNTAIGLAASGSGNISSFAATNAGTFNISGTIQVTPSTATCTGAPVSFTLTVYPTPTVSGGTTQAVCNTASTTTETFSSPETGTASFAWTNDNTTIGLGASSGSGNITAFATTNSGTTNQVAHISVTPTVNGCVGTSSAFTITVYPTPTVTGGTTQAVCNTASTTTETFSSPETGAASFAWTNDNTLIGIGTSGSGNIASFAGTNVGTTNLVGNIQVTPTVNGCVGTPSSFTITVYPTPTVSGGTTQAVCNTASTATETFSSPETGTASFAWTNDNTSIGLGASGSGNIASFAGTNGGTTNRVGNIQVTPTVNGCVGTPSSFTITVYPTPTVTGGTTQAVCNTASTTTETFSSPEAGTASFAWTNDNVSIGLGASGSGNITAFATANSGTTNQIAHISVTPTVNGCVGTSSAFTITVYPTPTVSGAATQAVCNGASTATETFSSPETGTASFAWTNDNTSIGLGASGSGNIASFAGINGGTTNLVGNIHVIPTVNGCVGTPSSFTITVYPTPTVSGGTTQAVCNTASTTTETFSSPETGTASFAWTNDNTSIGLGASGSGNIASFAGTNGGTSNRVGNIHVTPTVNGCLGTPSSFTITVYPTPTVSGGTAQAVCNTASTTTETFSSPETGTASFAWTNDNTSIGLGSSGSGNIASFAGANGGTTNLVGNIQVTPTVNGCVGTPSSFTITVYPTPTVTGGTSQAVCNTASTTTETFSSPETGTASFAWTNDNTSIGLGASGSGNIASFAGTNGGTTNLVGTIHVTPTVNGCAGTPSSFTIRVYPTPMVTGGTTQAVCNTASTATETFSSPETGTASFAWTNNNTSIGLGASGSGDIASFAGTNGGTTDLVGNIQVTPTVNGCVGTPSSFMITVYPSVHISLGVAYCASMSSMATITVTGTGGTGTITPTGPGAGPIPATFTSGGSSTFTDDLSSSGPSYIYTVTDANGCFASASTPVISTLVLTTGVGEVDACGNTSTGSVQTTPSGGNSPFHYAWTNSVPVSVGTSASVSGLPADVYNITVTDVFGCTASNSTVVNVDALMDLSGTTEVDATMGGGCNDGSVTIVVTGGEGTQTVTGALGTHVLAGGTYTFTGVTGFYDGSNPLSGINYSYTVTDGNGCSAQANIVVGCGGFGGSADRLGTGPKVSPNPSSGTIYVNGPFGTPRDEALTITVYDLLGQVVYSQVTTTNAGNVNATVQLGDALANGMYLMTLHTEVENKLYHIMLTR